MPTRRTRPRRSAGEGEAAVAPPAGGDRGRVPSTPEEAIADLRQKIDRLGPVNMMAIEQFDELDQRVTVHDDAAPGPRRVDRRHR